MILKNYKKIILSLISLLFFISFSGVSYAETFTQNGMTFTIGEHRPMDSKKEREYQREKRRGNVSKNGILVSNKNNQKEKPLGVFSEEFNEDQEININQENISEFFPEVNTQTHPLELNSGAHATIGGVWTNASSRALKENIINIDNEVGLNTVLNLQPVTYNYKVQPGEVYAGFIAEDVPEIVATSSRTSLSPMDIVAVVVGAIKEIWNKLNSILDRLSVIEEKLGIENKQEVIISNIEIDSDTDDDIDISNIEIVDTDETEDIEDDTSEDIGENDSEEITEVEDIEDESTEEVSVEENDNLEEDPNTQENTEIPSENIEDVEENQSEEAQDSEEVTETENIEETSGEEIADEEEYNQSNI